MKNNDFDYIPLSQSEESSVLNGAMAKINAHGKTQSKAKRFSIPVIIAAAIAVTGISAAAIGISGIDWFKSFYGGKSDTPLETYANAQMLDGMAQAYDDISVSKDGITVEFLGAIAYKNTCKFSFLTTNENLEDLYLYDDFKFVGFQWEDVQGCGRSGYSIQKVTQKTDSALKPNQYISIYTFEDLESFEAINNTLIFAFRNYGYSNLNSQEKLEDVLVDPFGKEYYRADFINEQSNIPFNPDNQAFKLIVPVPDSDENSEAITISINKLYDEIYVEKVLITPLDIRINVEMPPEVFNNPDGALDDITNEMYESETGFSINFKDGNSIPFKSFIKTSSTVFYDETEELLYGLTNIPFNTAIDLDQIESITFGGMVYEIN